MRGMRGMRELGYETKSMVSRETETKTRPPKITQQEAAFLLERGPYVARLAAQERRLAYAISLTTAEGEYGPNLPPYVLEELSALVESAKHDLTDFDISRQLPEADVIETEPDAPSGSRESLGHSAVGSTVKLHIITTQTTDWRENSLCAQTDPEAFHPEKGGSTREAKKVCMSCEVREECLHWALDNNERYGIWGGLSERERRKLHKKAV